MTKPGGRLWPGTTAYATLVQPSEGGAAVGGTHGRAVGCAGAVVAEGHKGGTAARLALRQLIDGIRARVRTAVPWRDVPAEHGPWNRVHDLFRRCRRNGTWHRILTRLQSPADAKGAITWDLTVDSAVCRAHQHAAGARKRGDLQKEPPGGVFTEPGDHGLERSRGGFPPKLHLAVEQGQKPMSIVVTAGQQGDSPQFGRMPPGTIAPTCTAAGSAAPSRTRLTRPTTTERPALPGWQLFRDQMRFCAEAMESVDAH
nr:transposase [Streptomyces sp. IMTB 1903]